MVKPASGSAGSPPQRLRRPPALESIASDRFKGVRRRSWGRWVSEIRIPHTRDKIWLGSYGNAEQAARAYDIASLLLRGPSCSDFLNFSDSSALVLSVHPDLAGLAAAGMPPSPHTIQTAAANAAAAAVSSPPTTHSAVELSIPADHDAAELLYDSPSHNCCDDPSGATVNTPHSCWIQDVITLILSPNEKNSPPSASRLSPTTPKCPAASHPNSSPSSSYGFQYKAPSPECLLYALFEDFHCPLEGLTRDGFTAISAAVTTHKRFDTETVGLACEVDSTQLWSYVC